MPEVHDPRIPRYGPSHSFASSKVGGRRRRRRRGPITGRMAPSSVSEPSFEFHEEDEARPKQRVLSQVSGRNELKCTTTIRRQVEKSKSLSTQRKGASPPPSHGTKSALVSPRQPCSTAKHLPELTMKQVELSTHIRNSILVDTRALDTKEGKLICQFFLYQVDAFVKSMTGNGFSPSSIATLYQKEQTNSSRSRPNIAVQIILKEDIDKNCNLSPMLIRPSINFGNVHKRDTIKVPTRFLASASWNIFGDLVQQALSNDTQTSPPLTITLFTYDASLLCDASMEDHKFALTRFWNRIRPHFHKNQLATIDIVLFHTGTVVAVGQQEHPPKQEIKTVDNKIADGIELSSEDESTKLKTANDAVSSLRRNLVDLAEADYKTDRNREHPVTPVSISVLLVERDESFGKISRRWTKRILSPPNLTRSISFALPEMSDGTQCSIFLDLSFRLLPYPIDVARGLLEDLRLLSSSIIEVIQVCPLSTVDANLLFGVAMEAIPGFQREEDRYREMKALVYVLFKKLRLKDIALLLRATPMHNVSSPSSSYGSPLHHTHHQTYLLSAEDFPATTQKSLSQVAIEGNPPLPVRGSLYRYGNADQMVIVGGGELYTPEVDTETLDQLNDYIEASIDFFPNSDINPLVNEGERMLINEVKHMKLVREVTNADKIFDESEKWSDKTGIGSTVALHRDFKDSTSSADNATSKRSANVDVATSNAAYEEKAAWNDGSSIASTMVEEKGDLSVVPARSLKFQQPSPTKNTAKKNGEQRAPIEEESNEKDESMDFETLSEQSFKENENLISSAVSAPEDFLKGPVNTARKGKVEANNQSFYCGELPSPHSYSSYGSLDDITKIVANALKRQKQSAIDCGTAAVSVAEKEEDQLELSEKTSNEVSSKEERTTENIVTSRKEGILKTNLKSLPQRKDVTVDACLFDTDEEPSKQIILYRACDEESVISDPITPCKTGNDNEAVSGNPASPHKEAKIEDATQHKYSSKHINHDNSSTDGNDKNYKENGKSNERGNGTFDYYGADSDDDWRGYRGVGFKGQKKETAKNDDSGGASGSNSESEPFVQMKARKSKLRIKYKGREEKEMSDKSVVCTENDEESTVKYASEDTSIERKEESKTKDRKLIVKSQKVEESSDDSDTSGEFGVYQKRKHKQSKLHAEVKAILEDSDIGSDF